MKHVCLPSRSLPADAFVAGPDQAIGSGQDRHRVVHGSQLELDQPGRHQQREELRQEESVFAEQAGQRALHPLASSAAERSAPPFWAFLSDTSMKGVVKLSVFQALA